MKLRILKYPASMTKKAILQFGCGIIGQMFSDAQRVITEEEV
jgi:hypothetical protein